MTMNKFEEYVQVAKELMIKKSTEDYIHAKLKAVRVPEEEIFLIIKAAQILKEDHIQYVTENLHSNNGERR